MGEEQDRVAMVSDVRAATDSIRSELKAETRSVRDELSERMDRLEKRIETRIKEEGETTRRHFDIMVEKVEASVRIVAEVNAHHAVVLDNHEARLKAIER